MHVLLLSVREQAVALVEEGGLKASSLPVPLSCSLTGQVSVKEEKKKKKRRTFLSADSRLSGEYYKVSKIDHYDVVKSFEGCVTLPRRRAIC
jgi:hypothetical protein